MTTIISNGYYLIADHRRGKDETSDVRNLISSHTRLNTDEVKVARTKKMYIHKDIAEKITLLPFRLPTRTGDAGMVMATAAAGNVAEIDRFTKLLLNYVQDKNITEPSLKHFVNYLKNLELKANNAIFFITDTNYTLHLSFKKSDTGGPALLDLKAYPPGRVVVAGSGGAKIKALSVPIDKIHPKDLFLIAQYLDPHTSPSYGVLGVAEEKYYPFVLEPVKTRNDAAKELIISHLKPNRNNDYKSLFTCDGDSYAL